MKAIKSISLFLFGVLTYTNSYSQNIDYVVPEKGDTIFCHIVGVAVAGANVTKVLFIDLDKKEQTLKGGEVKAYKAGDFHMEKVPLKPSKPKGFKRHMNVKQEGPIKVYSNIGLLVRTDEKTNERKFYSTSTTNNVSCILPNGKHYDMTSGGDIKKYIAPFLYKCDYVTNKFPKIKKSNIEQVVYEYNTHCGK